MLRNSFNKNIFQLLTNRTFKTAAKIGPVSSPKKEVVIPKPSEEIPDVQAFLTKIGRNSAEFADSVYENKWENLFLFKLKELKNKNMPIDTRRYVMSQVEKYRLGEFELVKEVKNGVKKNGGERKANKMRLAKEKDLMKELDEWEEKEGLTDKFV
ncbi:hypothetical protein HANVADRAFT_4508 [Hanseniaspora valbyensis NRRL Y-1626]|uniref:Small ribosomal subunit protein mS41 n=1 Tax=Hanseniaspora valbyensis NRRL Y-1626 TaxID=766949 RepID=A0A1B7T7F2_9ASCO|nr:hypothetical protein HANVADRAFT_4508 [Hanseniaspora valbyensis NRRL Y-1626]